MSSKPAFENITKVDNRTTKFQLTPFHVCYANSLRRLMSDYVETIGFRADMTDDGTTTDVSVIRNDTPMSNEMLAHRIGLLPINIKDPLNFKPENYTFVLKTTNTSNDILDVKAGDFQVGERSGPGGEPTPVPADRFFPPDPRTRQMAETTLLAVLRPKTYLQGININRSSEKQVETGESLEIIAKASIGIGKEHARFSPVCQCSVAYTRDNSPAKVEDIFDKWLQMEKKARLDDLKSDTDRLTIFRKEFETMAIQRSYLQDERGEPYSFDFTVESKGVLDVGYIVMRACDKGAELFARYAGMSSGKDIPDDVDVSPSEAEMTGFDFLFKGQDATLANMLQTYLVDNHIDGTAEPKITFAGWRQGHPLKGEVFLRVGVADRSEATARQAVAAAAAGCAAIFRQLKNAWASATGMSGAAAVEAKAPVKRTVTLRKTPATISTGAGAGAGEK